VIVLHPSLLGGTEKDEPWRLPQEQQRLADLFLAIDPESVFTLRAMAEEYREEGQFDKAVFCLRQAAEIASKQGLEPDAQGSIWLRLGRTLTDLGQLEEAERWLRQVMKVAEESPPTCPDKDFWQRRLGECPAEGRTERGSRGVRGHPENTDSAAVEEAARRAARDSQTGTRQRAGAVC